MRLIFQGEFSSLHMLVNGTLEIKDTNLFELSSSDKSRSVSLNILVLLSCFATKCLRMLSCICALTL